MLKNYTNNIQLHFIQRVYKYITEIFLYKFKKKNQELFNNKKKEYEKKEKEFLKIVWVIKRKVIDIDVPDTPINNEVINIFQNKINKLKSDLIPPIVKHVCYDLKADPNKFIFKMIFMNNVFEKLEIKQNNMFPLRHSFVPKSIFLDTNCISEILGYENINENAIDIWKTFFNKRVTGVEEVNNNSYYRFNEEISTNGYDVSIHRADKQAVLRKKTKFGRKIETPDVVDVKLNVITDMNNEVKVELKIDILDIKEDKPRDPPNIDVETKYISDLKKKQLKELKDAEYILLAVDPGKNNLLTMIDEHGKTLTYSSVQERFETKITLNNKKREDFLNQHPIIKKKIEEFVLCAATTDVDKFKEYIKARHKLYYEVEKFYQEPTHRRLKWHKYISTQKSQHKLIETIKETYGVKIDGEDKYDSSKILIGIGDWNEDKCLKNCMPTRGASLRRLLSRAFRTYLIEERYTSKTCSKCKHETEYYTKVIEQPTFKLNKSYIHGLLCCTNKNCSKLWSRDINAAINILIILKGHINDGERPPYYDGNYRDLH
jgi:hypothetical protein